MKNLVALFKELETTELTISKGAKGRRIQQTQSGEIKNQILDALVADMQEAGIFADRTLDGIGVDVQLDNPKADSFPFIIDAVMKPFYDPDAGTGYNVEGEHEAYLETLKKRADRKEAALKKRQVTYRNTTEAREIAAKDKV